MNLQKQKSFIIHVIFTIILLGILYLGIKYLLPLLMPFVIGIIIAVLFRPLIDFIELKTYIKRTVVSILVLIIFYSFIGYIVALIGSKTFTFLGDLFSSLPLLYKNTLIPAMKSVEDDLLRAIPAIRPYLEEFISNIDQSIFEFLNKISSSIVGMITGFAGQLPTLLIKLIFTIVSSFFFTIDYHKISDFIVLQFNEEHQKMLLRIKENGIGTIVKFIRAYSIIISITFIELSIGFWIMGISHPVIFGGLVALVDIMPIIGTGTIIIPWSIIAFILNNTRVGVGMLILYIFITAVRQMIEPKIVGQQIGLHPLVTLILMYVGAQLMGVLGLFLLPIIATLLIKLNEEGTIHLLKKGTK